MKNHRFVLDSEEYVVDTSNSNPRVSHYCVYDTSEKALRESVLIHRLNEFVDKLLVNNNPVKQNPYGGSSYRDTCPENFSLTHIIYYAVKASHLNIRDIAASLEHKFDGKLRRENKGWQDTTSIRLLINDIECLLRDLYGDFDDDTIESIRKSISGIVSEFLHFTRNDLWLEHESARDIDDYFEPSALLDAGICWDDLDKLAHKATSFLLDRVREFRKNPSAFGQYSAGFLTAYETQCAKTNLATANDFIEFAGTDSDKGPFA